MGFFGNCYFLSPPSLCWQTDASYPNPSVSFASKVDWSILNCFISDWDIFEPARSTVSICNFQWLLYVITKLNYQASQFIIEPANTKFLHGVLQILMQVHSEVRKWYPENLSCQKVWFQKYALYFVCIAVVVERDNTKNYNRYVNFFCNMLLYVRILNLL